MDLQGFKTIGEIFEDITEDGEVINAETVDVVKGEGMALVILENKEVYIQSGINILRYKAKEIKRAVSNEETRKFTAYIIDDKLWAYNEAFFNRPLIGNGGISSIGGDMTMPFLRQYNWELI